MQRYQHIKATTCLPEFRQEPDEEQPTPDRVQCAQRIVGELTWVACRTRLDVAYAVNRLSRYTVGYPTFAVACGEQILGYLFHTAEVKLRYGKCKIMPAAFQDELPVSRTSQLLEIWTDASFAQADSKSQSGVIVALGGAPIGWLSLRQPFISLSTCEAELVSCVEGVVLAQSLRPLLEELSGHKLRWLLLNDNVAASTVILYPSGSWRTRHLRLRSRAVQELVDTEQLALFHVPGRVMTADVLTKTLPYSKLCELMGYLGYEGFRPPEPRNRVSGRSPPKLLLLCAALPTQAEASHVAAMSSVAQGMPWVMICVVGVGLALLGVYVIYSDYRRWLTRVRLQRLRELADQVVAETEAQERHRQEMHRLIFPEPEPEENPEEQPTFWEFLHEHGTTVEELLGTRSQEILELRAVSPGIRMRIANAWALLHPRPPRSLRSEASEETDSGLATSTSGTPPSLSREWDAVHAQHVVDPRYDPIRVENAFQIWLASSRPYGPELDSLPYARALAPPEYAAFDQMIGEYYMHSASPVSTPTPEPSHLIDSEAGDEGVIRREVVERSRDQREYARRRQQAVEQTAYAAVRVFDPATEAQPPGIAYEGASEQDDEGTAPHDMDFQIAAAASLLYQYGYDFDWEQMTEVQQDIYHGMIGRLLRTIEEVD